MPFFFQFLKIECRALILDLSFSSENLILQIPLNVLLQRVCPTRVDVWAFIFILFKIFPGSLVISSLTSYLEICCLIFKYLGFAVTYPSVTDFKFNSTEQRICFVSS